ASARAALRSLPARAGVPARLSAGGGPRRRGARRRARGTGARILGGRLSPGLPRFGDGERRPAITVCLRDHAQGIGVLALRDLVRRRAWFVAADPGDRATNRHTGRSAILRR